NAYDKRKRAALGYAAGKHEGLSVNRRYSDGPIDEQVGVILVEDADGDPISIITNFAAHPTSVGGDDLFSFSADFPGFYYLEMEELLGPGCVPIFLNGAQGNQTTGNPEQKSGWGRTESIGRLLAQRAHKISNSITFGNVELRLFHKEARLPLTLLDNLLPEQVFLQALEINDLLISFFPGEACVELALEMRRRAQTHGYGAHFSVGLQNHLMYLVPRHLYPDPTYESSSTFFGPGIADWLYTNFESMMPGNESGNEEENEDIAEPVLHSQGIANGILLDLVGTPHAIGAARGTAFLNDIQECYKTRVIEPVDDGSALPVTGMFSYIPSFIETKTLALPVLGMGSRSLLQGISLDLIQEMEGMAEGARLPFDAFWLLQNAPLYGMIEDKSVLFATPLCTMFAVVGDRPGTKKLLVGRNLDWALSEKAVITRVHPEKGHAFIQAGFSWNTGVFTAMNDEGLTVCVERVQTKEVMRPEKAPVEFLLRDIVQYADGYEEALDRLRRSSYISGVHVLVAGFVDGEPRAAVVEFGEKIIVREEEDGLLLGVMPDNVVTDESGRSRYAKVAAYLEEIPLVGVQ
ncbi:MAG: hypothetical protein KAH38_10305, partial [Candidatus Hydrogenedentes bacterium]|nr:hypothetical protein [Candidatus Hydrogenedentota bacterium]